MNICMSTLPTTTLDAWRTVVTDGDADSEQLRRRIAAQTPAPEVQLWLVRHGETTTNAAGIMTGTTDAPLNVTGRLQAQEAGRSIAGHGFDIAFYSQLERSRESLELMTRAGGLKIDCVAEDERIAERHLGELERMPIRPRDPRLAVDLALAPTGGESYLALTRRCLSFLLDLRRLAAALGRPLSVLISTHQGPLRVLAGILEETADPGEMRERHIGNSIVLRATMGELAWPAFAGGAPPPLPDEPGGAA
jgi:broad specificity phosphatase PhoE